MPSNGTKIRKTTIEDQPPDSSLAHMVWFLTKNTRFAIPSRNLEYKREGHFAILKDLEIKTLYAY